MLLTATIADAVEIDENTHESIARPITDNRAALVMIVFILGFGCMFV